MRETCEFRVDERHASRLFAADEGVRLGDIARKVVLGTNDPRYNAVGRLQSELVETIGESFFYGWNLNRRYTKSELAQADAFLLSVTSVFEPAGEECGTKYDEGTACQHCGAGAKQTSELHLPRRSMLRRKDFSCTIADEIVISTQVRKVFERENITGVEFRPIRSSSSPQHEILSERHQLAVSAATAEICAPTKVGIGPFDADLAGECRCPMGDLIGLNLVSEVFVESRSGGAADVGYSKQFIGVRRGLLRPRQLIIVSPRVFHAIRAAKLSGVSFEVAYLR